MNRTEAKKLAEKTTYADLRQMFINAQNSITDWTPPSRVNKGMSLGAAFNILTAGFDNHSSAYEFPIHSRVNMILVFGEYLPGYKKSSKKTRPKIYVHHQEPVFLPLTPTQQ